MTVIVWSNKTLTMAADRQSVSSGLCRATTKIRWINEVGLLGTAGDSSMGHRLEKWFLDGRDLDKYPDKADPPASYMLFVDVVTAKAYIFDGGPIPDEVHEPWVAIGAGQDFAVGAMAAGATPVEAVKIANDYCSHCGMGYDELRLYPPEYEPF